MVFVVFSAIVPADVSGQVPVGPLTLAAYVQADGLFSLSGEPFGQEDTFRIRRARFTLRGEITPRIDWEVSAELSASPVLRDAFVTLKPAPWANVRVGQFVTPFSLERITSTSRLETIDRLIDTLTPSRDFGVELRSGRPIAGWLTYGLAVINGAGQNELDDNDAKDVVARVAAAVPGFQGLTVGLNGATGEQPDGRRTRRGADVELRIGTFRVATEFVRESHKQLPHRDGFYFLAVHRIDAVEFTARWSRLKADDPVRKRLELGGNYYFKGRTRLQTALLVDDVDGPETPVGVIARFQLAF
jgi:hypothetical protein